MTGVSQLPTLCENKVEAVVKVTSSQIVSGVSIILQSDQTKHSLNTHITDTPIYEGNIQSKLKWSFVGFSLALRLPDLVS